MEGWGCFAGIDFVRNPKYVPVEIRGSGSLQINCHIFPLITLSKCFFMEILRDKYFLLCLITCFVLVGFSFSYEEDSKNEQVNPIGVVTDVNESSKGYVFEFEDSKGNQIHCFSKTKPKIKAVCEIEGKYSGDGSIFFVSQIIILESK